MPKHCQWSAESVTAEQHPPLALTSAQTVWCKLHCMHFHGWADDVLIWPMPGVLGFVKPANPQKTWLWWTCFTVKLFRENFRFCLVEFLFFLHFSHRFNFWWVFLCTQWVLKLETTSCLHRCMDTAEVSTQFLLHGGTSLCSLCPYCGSTLWISVTFVE